MRYFPFSGGSRNEIGENHTEKETLPVSNGSPPEHSPVTVNNDTSGLSPTQDVLQVEPPATTSNPESNPIPAQLEDESGYVHGTKLVIITVAVALSVFLVALVCRPSIRHFIHPQNNRY